MNFQRQTAADGTPCYAIHGDQGNGTAKLSAELALDLLDWLDQQRDALFAEVHQESVPPANESLRRSINASFGFLQEGDDIQ